jgi:hypothetical protein
MGSAGGTLANATLDVVRMVRNDPARGVPAGVVGWGVEGAAVDCGVDAAVGVRLRAETGAAEFGVEGGLGDKALVGEVTSAGGGED